MPEAETKTTTYEMLGGGTISGSTPQELAEALRSSSFYPMGSLEEFIADVAKRCRAYDRTSRVRATPVSAFIEDLIEWEFLREPAPQPANVIAFPGGPDDGEEGEQ